jgi:hypothetical protein
VLINCGARAIALRWRENNELDGKTNKKLIYCPPLFSLPSDSKLLPTVANGHLGFTVLSGDVYMNGLYNGHRGLSHRARIPNFVNILLADCLSRECSYTLNARHGYFMVKLVVENEFSATQLIYAHRFHNRAVVNQIHIQRLGSRGEFEVASR